MTGAGGSGTAGRGSLAGGAGPGRPPAATGVTALEAADGGPSPDEFEAVTVNV